MDEQKFSAMAERGISSLGTVLLREKNLPENTLLILNNAPTHPPDDLEECLSDSNSLQCVSSCQHNKLPTPHVPWRHSVF